MMVGNLPEEKLTPILRLERPSPEYRLLLGCTPTVAQANNSVEHWFSRY
ncbi:hypothetical protein MYVALT_C_00110 [Candidatus Vallotia tarda]|uniref:Uncharacterized protein n=1 Tax=Candidatus Vallotiella hemipterorum TaxID=1177213 RepID=A0A916NFJ6_9BURK|nr:hypothetical protein MYVALT_C_00110 [Candidatus Vallotia tarda]